MKRVRRVDVGTLLQVTQALEEVLGRCFGPSGGQVLFTRDTGEVLITKDGERILTSLRLDHPIARVLVGCVSAHCNITGDGAKSFLLLLGALLRGIHGDHLHGVQDRRAAHLLLSFQTLVLDSVIGRSLAPHAPPLLHNPAYLLRLTDAYFRGKTASSHWRVLSRTACDFYHGWRCGHDSTGLALISRHFAALHTAVPGLPVSRSQVLQGLVFHRDFAVRCPGDGPVRALAVSVPLQTPLAPPGVTLSLASAAQVQRCCGRAGQGAEGGVAALRRLGVGLLLSAVKQSELALDLARRAGLSVVDCVDADELALFCRLTGVEVFGDPGDWSLIGEEHVATVTFCRPVILGPDRLAHVGFPEGRGLPPHCLVLCGPSPGLAEQCVAAFRGVFRMLQRAFEPVQSRQPQGQNAGHYTVKQPSPRSDTGLESAPTSIGDNAHLNISIRDNAHLSTKSKEPGGTQDMDEGPQAFIRDPNRDEGPQALIRDPNRGEGPLCAGQSQNPPNTESKAEPENLTLDWVRNGSASAERPGVHFGKGKEEWEPGIVIEAGSVLPAGGAFEFLLHHYLLQQASRSPCPDMRAACRLVAGAVLSVPRRLYPRRRFLDAQSRFLRVLMTDPPSGRDQGVGSLAAPPSGWNQGAKSLAAPPGGWDQGAESLAALPGGRNQGAESLAAPPSGWDQGAESLACKYQLLLSVLHTLTSLLSVDLILHTSVSSRKERCDEEEEDDDDDDAGDGD